MVYLAKASNVDNVFIVPACSCHLWWVLFLLYILCDHNFLHFHLKHLFFGLFHLHIHIDIQILRPASGFGCLFYNWLSIYHV